jgi:hypothetical protein
MRWFGNVSKGNFDNDIVKIVSECFCEVSKSKVSRRQHGQREPCLAGFCSCGAARDDVIS